MAEERLTEIRPEIETGAWSDDPGDSRAWLIAAELLDEVDRMRAHVGPGNCGDTFRADDGTRMVCDRIAGHGVHRGDGWWWMKDHAEGRPEVTPDLAVLRQFCATWLAELAQHGWLSRRLLLADGSELDVEHLNSALDRLAKAERENEKLRAELEGHRARQREAEDALAILLAREGGSTEITQAEMVSLDRNGSFVTSWTVVGNEKLAYVTSKRKLPEGTLDV
ncbi:hypothetical protein [Catenulispora acidiphila]|nr:hypothetical protein [Catenulispora acidiphila]